MRPFFFDRKRGNTSIGVLGLMVLITSLTIGHTQHTHTLILRGRGLPGAQLQTRLLGNAVQEIRIDGYRDRTETEIDGEPCAFLWQFDHTDGVRIERITARFPQHPAWPETVCLWIHYGERTLLINDLRHE